MARVFIKRTSTPNSPPTGLVPGELAVEMEAPTRLWVGVPPAQDPSEKKLLIDADNQWVKRAGDTMTGALMLGADPVAALEATTRQYAEGLNTPMFFARLLTPQPIGANTYTAVVGMTTIVDTHGSFINGTRFQAPVEGQYLVGGCISMPTTAVSITGTALWANNSSTNYGNLLTVGRGNTSTWNVPTHAVFSLNPTSYVDLVGITDYGPGGSWNNAEFWAFRIRRP